MGGFIITPVCVHLYVHRERLVNFGYHGRVGEDMRTGRIILLDLCVVAFKSSIYSFVIKKKNLHDKFDFHASQPTCHVFHP